MRQRIPIPRGHPQNIPGFKNSQNRMVAWFPENIPNIPNIPGMSGMDMEALKYIQIHKETLNFTLLIYVRMKKPNPRNPERRGDFGDIGDIFRKSLKLLDFLNAHRGDISGDFFGDGDISGDIFLDGDSHAQDTIVCAAPVDSTASMRVPKIATLRRIRWEERPETPENDWLAHLRARYHCVCAAPVDSMLSGRCYRGTPTTKSGRSVGVQTPGPPSW